MQYSMCGCTEAGMPHGCNFIYCDIEISLAYLLYSSQIGLICEKSCETMAGLNIVTEIMKKSIACLSVQYNLFVSVLVKQILLYERCEQGHTSNFDE